MEDLTSNKKYSAILGVSKKLFWKHGVKRVTIDEICHEARTSKMTFYRFFANKTELAKVVIDRYYEESLTKFREIIRADTSPAEKMQRIIGLKIEGSNDISNEFVRDLLSNNNEELSSYFSEKLKYISNEGIREFKNGQEEGWIRKDLNVEFMFFYYTRSAAFLAEPEMMAHFGSPKEMILEMSNLIIYGIIPRD
jgi:AcrR family transcriptional regulator